MPAAQAAGPEDRTQAFISALAAAESPADATEPASPAGAGVAETTEPAEAPEAVEEGIAPGSEGLEGLETTAEETRPLEPAGQAADAGGPQAGFPFGQPIVEPEFVEPNVIPAQPLDPAVAEAWQSPNGLVVPATAEAYRAARAAMAAHLIGPKFATEEAEEAVEQAELAFAVAAAAAENPVPTYTPPEPKERRKRRGFLLLVALLVMSGMVVALLPLAVGGGLAGILVAAQGSPGASGSGTGTPDSSSIAPQGSGSGSAATKNPTVKPTSTPGGSSTSKPKPPASTPTSGPKPTPMPTPRRTPTPTPRRTPAPTPRPTPTPTPTPAMFVAWNPAPTALQANRATTFTLSTLPGATCQILRQRVGGASTTSPTFLANAAGVASITWDGNWRSGRTYQLTATCTLGPRTASSPTITLTVP